MLRRCFSVITITVACLAGLPINRALAWGDEGHQIVALVGVPFLAPAVRAKVTSMLAGDSDDLTAHDIVSEATWADRYRDSDRRGSRQRYEQTWRWHFVDVELSHPDLETACFGHPPLPPHTLASNGPARACIVDKVNQFAVELSDPAINSEERLVALKVLLHLVGDLHQPLHAADDHDAGGNRKRVAAPGFRPGNLHHFWDVEFVARVGANPRDVAAAITAVVSDQQRQMWSHGTPADWTMEAFEIARGDAYGGLPAPSGSGIYVLDLNYINVAVRDVRVQLARAGVRLAAVLNRAFGEAR